MEHIHKRSEVEVYSQEVRGWNKFTRGKKMSQQVRHDLNGG